MFCDINFLFLQEINYEYRISSNKYLFKKTAKKRAIIW